MCLCIMTLLFALDLKNYFCHDIVDAAFTLVINQERNPTFVKTDFYLLKLKFHACNFKTSFYPLHKLYIA